MPNDRTLMPPDEEYLKALNALCYLSVRHVCHPYRKAVNLYGFPVSLTDFC